MEHAWWALLRGVLGLTIWSEEMISNCRVQLVPWLVRLSSEHRWRLVPQAYWPMLSPIHALNMDLPAAYQGPQSGSQNSLSPVDSGGGREGQTGIGLWHLSAKKASSTEKQCNCVLRVIKGHLWQFREDMKGIHVHNHVLHVVMDSTFLGILKLLAPGRSPRTLPSTKIRQIDSGRPSPRRVEHAESSLSPSPSPTPQVKTPSLTAAPARAF